MRRIPLLLATFMLHWKISPTNNLCGTTTRLSLGYSKKVGLEVTSDEVRQLRVQAPLGLHVKASFGKGPSEVCQAHVTLDSGLIINLDQLENNRSETYKASSLTVVVTSLDGDCIVPIVVEAVVPTGGVCGFEANATESARVIISPGFPRVNAPKGLRCVWILRSRPDQYIMLDIRRFKTLRTDYLEIYDGAQRVGQLSGKYRKYMILRHFAYSGEMRIYFHTKTSRSKGFKAKYKTIEVEGAPEAFTWSGEIPTRVFQCHKRKKLELNGRLYWDSHSKTACPTGNVCLLARAIGRSTEFPEAEAVAEIAQCAPAFLCNSICNQSALHDVSSTSCDSSCCSTDLCNKYPNWSEDPPNEGLRCQKKAEELMPERRSGTFSNDMDEPCPAGTVCGLYVYQGTSTNSGSFEEEVSGYEAKCMQPKACTSEACVNRYSARSIDVTSCVASCCATNRCNQPPESIPTPTPAGSVTQCHYLYRSYSEDEVFSNYTSEDECYDYNSRCLRIDVTVVDRDGTELNISHGKCISKESCDWLQGCKLVTDSLEKRASKNCRSSCCDFNLCNGDT